MIVLAGRYRLVAPLGRGGMGTVWRAFDELLRQEVAVKEVRLPPDLSERARAELSERTLREARAAAKLRSHPSIVTVHDVVVENDRPWIVMELLTGRSLDQVIRESGPLPAREVANIGLALLDALSAAHGAGILHRDVKPGNVLLTDDARVVLTDFGIATVAGDTALTQAGQVSGSPGYIAPERLRGEPETPDSDIWSLGATLYAAVEGHSPFARDNHAAIMAAVLMHAPAPMRNAGPLAPVLTGLLEKDIARRCPPAHAAALLRAVAGGTPQAGAPFPVTGDSLTPATVASGAHARPKRPRRPWTLIALSSVLTAALIGGGAFALLHDRGRSPAGQPLLAAHTPSRTPSQQPVFTADPTACDLLEPSQFAARNLLGGRTKETYQGQNACLWMRNATAAFVQLVTIRQSGVTLTHAQFGLMRKQMEDQIRRNRTTDPREARTAGDETYAYTQKQPGVLRPTYHTEVMFRTANLLVTVDYTGPRSGYQVADKAVQLIVSALGPPH